MGRDEDLQWLREAYRSGQLSDDARRVCDIAQLELQEVLRELETCHDAQVEAIDRMHRERYARLEARYLRIVGVGLKPYQKHARWIGQLEDHLLFLTSSPEEVERFKEDLVRRIEHYRSRTRHRRTRGRHVGSLNYTPAARREAVEAYARRRARSQSRDAAAALSGDHKPDTLEKWARELGFDRIKSGD